MLLRFWSLPTWTVNTMFASLIWSGTAAIALFVFGLFAESVTEFEFLEPVRAWIYSPALPEMLSTLSGASLSEDATDDFWNFSFALGGMTLLVALFLTVAIVPICILALRWGF